jgi:Uma2 family endonuclease
MPRRTPSPETEIDFEQAARDYCARLPLEHFMEAIPQATQRKIFVVAGDLVHALRPDIHAFNELLVQWVRKGRRKLGQVVPDNMVVVWPEPIEAESSYNVPKQPVGPFWVLEYVSKGSERKDYEDSFQKYERELKVPYYLIFYPDNEELTLYRHNGEKYVTVTPNQHGRYPIPELEMEVGLLDGWARFWFRGELLPLPAEMQRQLDEARKERDQARRDLEKEREAREALEREIEKLRAQLAQAKKPGKRP